MAQKRKILYYSDCYIFGGCENVLVNLISEKALNEQYEVSFAYRYSQEYQSGVDAKLPSGIKKLPLRLLCNDNIAYRLSDQKIGMLLKIMLRTLETLRKTGIYSFVNYIILLVLFMRIKPQILHINNGGYPAAASCRVAVFSARTAGISHILFHVNNLAASQKGWFDKLVDGFIRKNVSMFITASAEAKSRLISERGFPESKITQIVNVVKPGKLTRSKAQILAEFGVRPDMFIISEVALLTERKGQAHLLRALNRIKSEYSDIYNKLVILLVGEGEDRSKLEQYIKDNGLTGHAVLTGQRADYYDFINVSDLFVLPSIKNEDMPLVILDAMQLKKPIIATQLAGIKEEIRDGLDGVLLKVEEIENIANVIVDLYRHPEKMTIYAESALLRYTACFDFNIILGQYQMLYQSMLSEAI